MHSGFKTYARHSYSILIYQPKYDEGELLLFFFLNISSKVSVPFSVAALHIPIRIYMDMG